MVYIVWIKSFTSSRKFENHSLPESNDIFVSFIEILILINISSLVKLVKIKNEYKIYY